MKLTPNVFPSRQSRSWPDNAFRTQARAILPEPARELSTEAPSHPRPKRGSESCILETSTLLGEQTAVQMHLCSAKQRWPFSTPSHWVSIGQIGSGLPLAPWALLLCWCSPEREIHSKHVLLRGEAGVGRKIPSGRRPQQSPRIQLESSATRPYLTLRSKLHAGSCIRESSTLLGEQTTAPMRLCIAKHHYYIF